MKVMALVVENERPAAVKYAELVVEKKLRVSFQASLLVVLNESPADVKKFADEVENDEERYVAPSRPSNVPVQFPVVSR
jgi:hypothetical protein